MKLRPLQPQAWGRVDDGPPWWHRLIAQEFSDNNRMVGTVSMCGEHLPIVGTTQRALGYGGLQVCSKCGTEMVRLEQKRKASLS